MKVRLYIESDLWAFDECYVEAEFFSAPRVGDYVTADWDIIKEAIIKADKVSYYREYLSGDSYEWYSSPILQKTLPKPTDEQIREELDFECVGKISSESWIVKEGVAYCRAWVGEM